MSMDTFREKTFMQIRRTGLAITLLSIATAAGAEVKSLSITAGGVL
jgi:hypothetical protein